MSWVPSPAAPFPPDDDEEPPPGVVFNIEEARRLKHEGMGKAWSAQGNELWKRRADAWAEELPVGAEVHTDDQSAAIGLPNAKAGANENNVVGAWWSRWSRSGRLIWTGRWHAPERPPCHKRSGKQKVWRKVR